MRKTATVEMWGGIECTINRVADSYLDQLEYSGHYNRDADLQLFADLGIKKMRYPVLWEKHQSQKDADIDWKNTGERLLQLKRLGIEPIAGLVHHGSGPAWVNMMDDSFAQGLGAYAARVASEFPWVNYYTPINEPLTTARFCGLYGFWHPHKKNDKSFVRILYNECKATVLAMQAIREINPGAKLIQTEDLGKVHSTPLLKYQADFENKRRWLGFDLLCGKVTPAHSLWKYLIKSGLSAEELNFFIDSPCPPDMMGFNYYLTSERYLDEKIRDYPPHTHGGNKRHRYADVEVLRVGTAKADGLYKLIRQAWGRFKLPIAITEVHLHCTREEQMRWLNSVWKSAAQLKEEKIDIRAMTVWAMLGSFGWNRLLTRPYGDYEAGVFDVRSGAPRFTALCKIVKSLAEGNEYKHPVLTGEGWWNRDSRVIYYPEVIRSKIVPLRNNIQPLLIVGKSGTLGNAFAHICKQRNIAYQLLGRDVLDISDKDQVRQIIHERKPWALVNAAGYVRVDDAESDCETCFRSNSKGPENLAVLCEQYNVKLITFSSDLVFDGSKGEHYIETDEVNPLNIYGQSKALAEQLVLQADPNALVIRTSAFFGPWDQYNFVWNVLNSVKNKIQFHAADDLLISPTYVPDLVNTSLDLLIDDEKGIWHLANNGSLSWFSLAQQVAERSNCDPRLVIPASHTTFDLKAVRPRNSTLKSIHGSLLPSLDDSLGRYFNESLHISHLIHTA